jgi:stage V sporulation protein SpoVS
LSDCNNPVCVQRANECSQAIKEMAVARETVNELNVRLSTGQTDSVLLAAAQHSESALRARVIQLSNDLYNARKDLKVAEEAVLAERNAAECQALQLNDRRKLMLDQITKTIRFLQKQRRELYE